MTAHGVRAVPLAVDLADSAALEGVMNRAAADLGRASVCSSLPRAPTLPGSAEALSLAD